MIFLILFSFSPQFPVQAIVEHTFTNDSGIESTSVQEFQKIGYYTNSSSEYSNAAFKLLEYNGFGPYLVELKELSDLSGYSMVIIPFKSNWTEIEVNTVLSFVDNGGIVYLTRYTPRDIFDVDLQYTTEYTSQPASPHRSVNLVYSSKIYYNYNKFFKSTNQGYFPSELVRNVSYISGINEDQSGIKVLHYASSDSDGKSRIGDITITKKIGSGRVAFSSAPILDYFGQRGLGGPILEPQIVGTAGSGGNTPEIIKYMVTTLYQLENRVVPYHWHTPNGKLGAVMSRDDVDSYYVDAVEDRGNVDRDHGIASIFYELRDDIPQTSWTEVLDIDTEYPNGYHLAGLHRHTGFETTNDTYLARIQDIQNETGIPMYFECHHGAGSGFYGQNYVRTAVEATNQLDHPIVYTSSEGGHWNTYIEPYLYRSDNDTIVTAKNYYAFPKSITIDSAIYSQNIESYKRIFGKLIFQMNKHPHYLLHSQNVRSSLTTVYDRFLTEIIDPLYEYLYTDPVEFVFQSLDHAENVSLSHAFTDTMTSIQLEASNDIEGYSLYIPVNQTTSITNIALDGSALSLENMTYQLTNQGYFLMFAINMTKGTHTLDITFAKNNDISFPNDTDGDLIQDIFEEYLGLNTTQADLDGDNLVDGLEIFVYNSDPNLSDTDSDGLTDYEEAITYGTSLRNSDTDYDGYLDSYEITNGLDPLVDDSNVDGDNDGIPDVVEIVHGLDPTIDDTGDDLDGDGMPNGFEYENGLSLSIDDSEDDLDEDGLTNLQEYLLGTSVTNDDSDSDKMKDGYEVEYGLDPLLNDADGDLDGDGLTNLNESKLLTDPSNEDSDQDMIPDGWEVKNNLDPLLADNTDDGDNDTLNNYGEYHASTDPNNNDTDGDTMIDGWEVVFGLDPLVDDANLDADGDGLTNIDEYNLGTNPSSIDTDRDGMPDGWEIENGLDPLMDDAQDDPDLDGIANIDEYNYTLDPYVSNSDPTTNIPFFVTMLVVLPIVVFAKRKV